MNPPSKDRDEGPAVVAFQPYPRRWRVSSMTIGAATISAVQRTWDPMKRGQCKLCPLALCNYSEKDHCCLVLAEGYIGDEEAPTYSTLGLGARGVVPLPDTDLAEPPAPGRRGRVGIKLRKLGAKLLGLLW